MYPPFTGRPTHTPATRGSGSEDPLRMGHYESLFNAPDLVATYCYESRGTLIAARSAFRHRRNLLSWTSCYDPDFRDYRLGKVLQYDILDHILTNDDVDEFDLGAGRYPWKFEWTRHFRQLSP
ncbi:MAG: GNAT family N-acetyltransferase [Tetrasphaera sp.]